MGARQSKRSVDITTTPKKGEGEVAVGEEKIEKLGDADVKAVVTNGTAAHTDIEFADKDEECKEPEEKPTVEIKENGLPETSDGEKTPDKESVTTAAGDQSAKTEEIVVEKTPENCEKVAETPESKKQKEKKKKKWSLRSISFSKKDKSKPSKEKEKNGEVEEVNEEKTEESATSPSAEAVKTDDAKAPVEEATSPVSNGDATKEELGVKIPETVAEVETENVKTVETPVVQASVEAPKDEPKVEDEAAVVVEKCEKPAVPEALVEETSVAPSAVEEVKEVRNEEVPPPLPSSNPPSQVTVFAESTKANVMLLDELQISENPISPVVESVTLIESPKAAEVEIVAAAVESAPIATEAPIPQSPVEKVPTPEEVLPTSPALENASDLDNSVATTESSPLIVEVLPKQSEDSLQDVASEASSVTVKKDEIKTVAPNESNLSVDISEESNQIESEQTSVKTDNIDSTDSIIGSNVSDEVMPVVSSAGDVPQTSESQPSILSADSSLDTKSAPNLKESPVSQEEQSTDLSVIPEADSNQLKLEEDNLDNLPDPISLNADVKEVPSPTQLSGSEKSNNDLIVEESSSTLAQKETESVPNAESLPDLSTESLPSLPEPTDSLLEPMSLPPLDSVPEPLVDDNQSISPTKIESPTLKPAEIEPPVVLTNGNATNGLKSSPTADDDDTPLPPPLDGPLKQIPTLETTGDACEKSQTTTDAPAESVASAPATAE